MEQVTTPQEIFAFHIPNNHINLTIAKEMRIKEGFELRELCGEHIVIAHGEKNIDFSKIISLNESAALMWQTLCDKDFSADDMAEVLLSNYEVDRETALKDALHTMQEWKEIGLAE